jgi:hypothetical protein
MRATMADSGKECDGAPQGGVPQEAAERPGLCAAAARLFRRHMPTFARSWDESFEGTDEPVSPFWLLAVAGFWGHTVLIVLVVAGYIVRVCGSWGLGFGVVLIVLFVAGFIVRVLGLDSRS